MTMKTLPCGVAVIEFDTHVSKWVEQSGTLRIAEKMLAPFRKYIPEGGVVVDAGAMIGDHTVTYADWVCPNGRVYAFEPNPAAFECLEFNMREIPQVRSYRVGLSDKNRLLAMEVSENAGASYLVDTVFDCDGTIKVLTLDAFELTRVDFLKIDVEGFEARLLRGAKDTITKFRPTILAEVNSVALERAGSSRRNLLNELSLMGYLVTITDPRLSWDDPQYDVICLPSEKS